MRAGVEGGVPNQAHTPEHDYRDGQVVLVPPAFAFSPGNGRVRERDQQVDNSRVSGRPQIPMPDPSPIYGEEYPSRQVLELIGDKWTMIVIYRPRRVAEAV